MLNQFKVLFSKLPLKNSLMTISGNSIRYYTPSFHLLQLPRSSLSLFITGVRPVAVPTAPEGTLDVCGDLPFLSAVAFEGCYPTGGLASVSYGSGDGNVGSQNIIGGLIAFLASVAAAANKST